MKRAKSVLGAAVLAVAAGLAPELATAQSSPDFLFKRPSVSFGFRVGYTLPRAASDIFDQTRSDFTVGTSDFYSATFGGEFAFRASERLDIALGLDFSRSETESEYRDFIGGDDLPILQTTRFTRVPTTLSARYYLKDRGRSISRFAWIPEGMVPYVGGGAGVIWYEFEQEGEFIEMEFDNEGTPIGGPIFIDNVRSSEAGATAHAMAGIELSINPRFVFNTEARYSWASVGMGSDFDDEFVGFDNIDLSGVQFTAGFSVRF